MGTKKRNKREHMNDLLFPILCILCLMPFVVHLAEYDYGYGSYPWHSDNSVAQDLYAYYRSYFFELVAVVSLFILSLRMAIYRDKHKPSRIYLPLAVYGVFVTLSAAFPINPRASLTGNFYQFQSILVLSGYCLMSFYTYQVMESEQDYQTVTKGIAVSFLLLSVSGWFQAFGHDILNLGWAQRLIMSEHQFAEYGGSLTDVFSGNNVFLTLYNPNYAAVFLVMVAAVFAVLAFGEQQKKKRACFLLLLIASLMLLWFTYTRAAFVALAAGAAVFALCRGKQLLRYWKYILPGLFLLAAVFIGADAVNGFRFLSRVADDRKDSEIEEIRTTRDGIAIVYGGRGLVLSMEEKNLLAEDQKGNPIVLEQNGAGEWLLPFHEEVAAIILDEDGETSCMLQIEGYTLEFVRTQDGYFYRNEDGKLDEMREIPHIDMHGMEYLGSGRLYIWSRVIPLLKDYMLAGSGPDTFAEAFPQDDYVGKMVYAGSVRRVMEGAHNDYLTSWVQTGLASLLSLLVFYALFLKRCFTYYRSCPLGSAREKLGFGCFLACVCYLVCCLFCDSSLFTTPVFYVFAGVALAAARQE